MEKMILGGRFQPFHDGHFQMFQWLEARFKHVIIATSNTTGVNSPFNFKEKQLIIHELYGIPMDRIQESRSPCFKPTEIIKPWDIYCTACSEKDQNRYQNKRTFIPYESKKEEYGLNSTGYYVIVPRSKLLSGSDIRNACSGTDSKTLMLESFYQKKSDVFKMMVNKL